MDVGVHSIEDVVHVQWLRGSRAPVDASPDLLVEVPHGADRLHHYERLREQLRGDLPADLHDFFFINTDVGAWDLGVATASAVVARQPTRSALLLRSLIPRTFIDCNRPATKAVAADGATASPLSAGIPAYVRDPRDLELLADRHRRYVATAEAAYALCLDRGGIAFTPHTYGPRSLDVPGIGDDIVEQLHRASAPGVVEKAPLRAEIDLLTRDGDGAQWAPDGIERELLDAFGARGLRVAANETYHLHPATLAHTWSSRWPGRVLCLEVRRDLLVEAWTPFAEMRAVPGKVSPIAEVIAEALAAR